MILESNTRYKASLKLSFIESIASNEILAKKLTDLGFSEVVITGTGAQRSATGLWTGTTMEVAIPHQVKTVEKA